MDQEQTPLDILKAAHTEMHEFYRSCGDLVALSDRELLNGNNIALKYLNQLNSSPAKQVVQNYLQNPENKSLEYHQLLSKIITENLKGAAPLNGKAVPERGDFLEQILPPKNPNASFSETLAHAVTVFNHASLAEPSNPKDPILPEHLEQRLKREAANAPGKTYPSSKEWLQGLEQTYPDSFRNGEYKLGEAVHIAFERLKQQYPKEFNNALDKIKEPGRAVSTSLAPTELEILRKMDNELNRANPQTHRFLRDSITSK